MSVWHVATHEVVGVTTSSRVKLGWEVPNDRWAEYTDKVEEEWGETNLYAGIQIEESWREYCDVHPLETYVNRLLEAAGLSREVDGKNNFPSIPSLADTESSRQFVRVHEDVKHGMEQYAAANDITKHEVLRGVIAWYLGGSKEERLIEKLERVVPEAERSFAQDTDDGSDTAGDLSKTERITRRIARSLGNSFSEKDLKNAIDAETTGTDYYHNEYTPRVVEYKGVKRWEYDESPDIYLSSEIWEKKKTTEIVSNLSGDCEMSPPSFTKEEFAQAVYHAGIEVHSNNREVVNKYRERVLERIEFAWSDETEHFEPVDDSNIETRSNPSADNEDDTDADVDSEPTMISDETARDEDAIQTRADGGDSEDMTQ